MPNLNIVYPRKKNQETTPVDFIAWGEVDKEAVRVEGTIQKVSGPIENGTQLSLFPKRRKKGDAKKLVWLIGFKKTGGFPKGDYTLIVTAYDAAGKEVDSDTRDIELAVIKDITIAFPSAGDLSVDEASSLTAYGTHTTSVHSATMNNIPAISIFDDLEVGFWAATFPPLLPATYTLLMVDISNNSASQGNIKVIP